MLLVRRIRATAHEAVASAGSCVALRFAHQVSYDLLLLLLLMRLTMYHTNAS